MLENHQASSVLEPAHQHHHYSVNIIEEHNIFQVLPDDLIIGELLPFLNSFELLFSLSRVCKYWKATCYKLIWRDYGQFICNLNCNNFKSWDKFDEQSMMDKFLLSKEGLKFSKYLLRKQVFEFVCKLSKFEIAYDQFSISVTGAKWIDSEIEVLKGYFQMLSIKETMNEPMVQADSNQSKGFFKSALSFLGSFFVGGKNSSTTTTSAKNTQQTVPPPSNQLKTSQHDVEYLTKVVLDGFSGAGKSSFVQCAILGMVAGIESTVASIGVDFGIKNYNFGTARVKLQLWDQNGSNMRYRALMAAYYRRSETVLLLVDPYSDYYTLDSHSEKIKVIQQHAPNAEVIIITTKKDLRNDIDKKRSISTEEAELFAYNKFGGGLYFDITNTELTEPRTIALYCALMRYLTFNENE